MEREGQQVLNFCSGLGLPSKRMIHVGNWVRAVPEEGED